MNEAAYIDWFNKARRNGVIEDAVRAYYMDAGFPLYQAELSDGQVTLPITTQQSWQEPRETHIRETVQQRYSSHDDAIIEQRLRWVAAQADVDIDVLRERLYNNPSLRPLEMTKTEGNIIVGERDYLTQLTHHETMVREIGEALWRADVQPNANETRLSALVPSLPLQRRKEAGRTLDALLRNIRDNCGYFGVHAATVVNTGDQYEILSADRVSDALAYPRRRGTVPSGNMEPVTAEYTERAMLMKEFVEEVLVDEWNDDPEDATEATTAFHKARKRGQIQVKLTSMQLGLVGPDLTINGLVLVNDPEFYDEFIRGQVIECDEHAAVHRRPVADEEAHAAFMRDKNAPAVHRAAQHEALCYLRNQSSIDIPLYGRSIQTDPTR